MTSHGFSRFNSLKSSRKGHKASPSNSTTNSSIWDRVTAPRGREIPLSFPRFVSRPAKASKEVDARNKVKSTPTSFRWMSWLHPRNWKWRKGSSNNKADPQQVMVRTMEDQEFLRSLVQYTEGSMRGPFPAFHLPPQVPIRKRVSFRTYSPPPVLPEVVEDDFSTILIVEQPTPSQPPSLIKRSESNRRAVRATATRLPHPPSSFPTLHPHARSGSTTSIEPDTQLRLSLNSTNTDRSSPLFYRSPAPFLCNKIPRPRLSSHSIPPDFSFRRSPSITISIETEDGQQEMMEFPTPPPRSSGCWFADRRNNDTPYTPSSSYLLDEVDEEEWSSTLAASSSSGLPPLLAGQGFQIDYGSERPTSETDGTDFDEEEMDSVYSIYADVKMQSHVSSDFVLDDALSESDSIADPSFRPLYVEHGNLSTI